MSNFLTFQVHQAFFIPICLIGQLVLYLPKFNKRFEKSSGKIPLKNKAKSTDDKKSLEKVEKPEKKLSKKETTKKSIINDESTTNKKKTKQVKAEIIDNEVEKELKTTSKSKTPKAKK